MKPPQTSSVTQDTSRTASHYHPPPRYTQSNFQTTLHHFFCPTPSHSAHTTTSSPKHASIPIRPTLNPHLLDDDVTITSDTSDDSSSTKYSSTLHQKIRRTQLASAKAQSLPSTATKFKSTTTFAAAMWKKVMDKRCPAVSRTECTMNADNLRTNYAWGHILAQKSPDVYRIISNNINGIRTDAHGSDLRDICHRVDQIEADVCCFQETKLNTWNYKIYTAIQSTVRGFWPNHTIVLSTSKTQIGRTCKPGGTMTVSYTHLTLPTICSV